VTEKFEFIDAERAAAAQAVELPTVSGMCALLEVSKSGYYEWRHRPESVTQRRRELLADKIAAFSRHSMPPTATGASTPNCCAPANGSGPNSCASSCVRWA
jgi:hypothetical protein